MSDLLRIAAVFALVGVNGFFVIGEYAVVTARRGPLSRHAEEGSAGARAALRLMEDPVRVISTVQIGITAIGILTGAIGEPLVRELLGPAVPDWLGFLIGFAIVTYLSVVLGELVPKALTLERSEVLAVVVARPIEFVAVVFKPAAWVLQGSARVLLRPFGIREVVAGDSITSVDDLRAMVDEAEGAGVIPAAQEELLYNAFDFPDQEVRDIMVPAPDVAWLDADLSPEAALDRVLEFPHERYPVGHGSLDQLAGVVHVRDLIAGARGDAAQTVGELARAVPVVPETKDLGALLREQREAREQLAVVADEYGGTAGIVSLEDILEQLVGEIEDEYDLPNASLTWVDARTVLASGSISIDDFNEAVGTELPREGQKTLAGVIFDALGRQPREGDAVSLAEVDACVTALDGVRITELRLRIPDEAGQLRGPSPRRRVGGIRGDDRDPRS